MPGSTIAAECSPADFDPPSSSAAKMGHPASPAQLPPTARYRPSSGRRKDEERNCRSAAAARGSQGRCRCGGVDTSDGTVQTGLAGTQRLRAQIHQSGQAITQTARDKKCWRLPIRLNSRQGRVVPGLEVKDKPNRRGCAEYLGTAGACFFDHESLPLGAMSASIKN
jgi:hypothetical protein